MARRDMLRLLTGGSVDDGKSTLIGRILYESDVLTVDQLALLEQERTDEACRIFPACWLIRPCLCRLSGTSMDCVKEGRNVILSKIPTIFSG